MEIPGLHPKSHGEPPEGFLSLFKGSGTILLYMLHRSLKLQREGEDQRGRVEAGRTEGSAIYESLFQGSREPTSSLAAIFFF